MIDSIAIGMVGLGTTGNLASVSRAFQRIGVRIERISTPDEVRRCRGLVLPGVGTFAEGMARLTELDLVGPIREQVLERGTPILGICLGMQLMAEMGEEHGEHQGLGLVAGRVVRLPSGDPSRRIPNMGWCDLQVERSGRLFERPGPGACYYFAHSFHLKCTRAEDIAATIHWSEPVTAAVESGSVLGVQFHPEKSQEPGLDLLQAFARSLDGERSP